MLLPKPDGVDDAIDGTGQDYACEELCDDSPSQPDTDTGQYNGKRLSGNLPAHLLLGNGLMFHEEKCYFANIMIIIEKQ
jgi:hypothetical protein